MSTNEHPIEVVPVQLLPFEGSDHLSLVQVYGYQVVVRTESWIGITKAAYAPPDSLLPADRPEFEFIASKSSRRYSIDAERLLDVAPNSRLAGEAKARNEGTHVRVTAIRLRGKISHGCLFPVPDDIPLGTDVAERYGIHHWNRPEDPTGMRAPSPKGYHPCYSVASYNRWGQEILVPGERIIVTEKINGENCRLYFDGHTMHVGSRTDWYVAESVWGAAITSETIALAQRSRWTLYGELYGNVAGMKYGRTSDNRGFRLFDAYDHRTESWVDYDTLDRCARELGVNMAPLMFIGEYDHQRVEALAHGIATQVGGDHMAEGIVIRTPFIRAVPGPADRTIFKLLNDDYLERSK